MSLGKRPLFVEDHLAALRRVHLKPLDDLPSATRDRMPRTLTSWLMHMGNRDARATPVRGSSLGAS
jgi:hypothetical protein